MSLCRMCGRDTGPEGSEGCTCNLGAPAAAPAAQRPCPDCEGSGVIWTHDCRTEVECAWRCPREEPCMACLATGRAEKGKG